MFGQLSNRVSLRDLIVATEAHMSNSYHLGFGVNVTRSNLSKANQNRDYRIFEEITLTYVVVRIWDQRRLILPSGYFLEQPFQNWTRSEASIMGTIFLYVSYELPVKPLREHLSLILKGNPDWDGRVQNIQVTASKEWHKEIRVLLSSSDASKNWDLRVNIREQLIDFINREYPGSFSKIETKLSGSQLFQAKVTGE